MTNYETRRFPERFAGKKSHLKDVYLCYVRSEKIVTTYASFCLFICVFVFASDSGHFRITDFLLFFTPLLLLNYFFNLLLFLQKSGVAKAAPPPAPPSARSLENHCLTRPLFISLVWQFGSTELRSTFDSN